MKNDDCRSDASEFTSDLRAGYAAVKSCDGPLNSLLSFATNRVPIANQLRWKGGMKTVSDLSLTFRAEFVMNYKKYIRYFICRKTREIRDSAMLELQTHLPCDI